VRAHAHADPLADPGEADLTAHVDFGALARAAAGVRAHGPVGQGALLRALGIEARVAALAARATPAQAEQLRSGAARLTDATAMGDLFRALALVAPDWPQPAGFP
jgi:SAM-dependent MidA family methyltransferase